MVAWVRSCWVPVSSWVLVSSSSVLGVTVVVFDISGFSSFNLCSWLVVVPLSSGGSRFMVGVRGGGGSFWGSSTGCLGL